jgi:hypothetical protein
MAHGSFDVFSFDPTQAQWLAVAGVVFDIFGAVILSRAFILSRAVELARQIENRWAGNSDLLRALCEQSVDARFGVVLLVGGFAMQAASSAGVKIPLVGMLWLSLILAVIVAGYLALRQWLVRRYYMAAVDKSNSDDQDKTILRRLFGKPG